MIEKFKTLAFVKSSLVSLYLAFTLPIPIISNNEFKLFSIITFVFGLFLIIDITTDSIETCDKKISYKTTYLSQFLGKKSWVILWKDIKLIKSFPTSQGSKVHYFVTNKDESFLIPQRIEDLEKFVLIISKKTKLDTFGISYISPLWTYKLLTTISGLMIIGELLAFLN